MLHESGVIAGGRRSHIDSEKECVGEFEIRKLRIEHCVGEEATTLLLLASRNPTSILEILGAAVRVIHPGNDSRAVTIGGATPVVLSPGRSTSMASALRRNSAPASKRAMIVRRGAIQRVPASVRVSSLLYPRCRPVVLTRKT